MRVLLAGDVVGNPGRRVFKLAVAHLKESLGLHAVIVNGENAAAGSGITEALGEELFAAGADVITLGDHVWNQRGSEVFIGKEKRVVRPANLPEGVPGRGWTTVQTTQGPLTVVSLLGRVFMPPAQCPFTKIDQLLSQIPAGGPILVEFHAEATSEKIAMGWHLDGRVTAVVGTHTHVQTSDNQLLPAGTAYLTDLGMTGPRHSVIGRQVKPVLKKFLTGMPQRFEVAKGPAVLEGAIVEINRETRQAVSIERVRILDDGSQVIQR